MTPTKETVHHWAAAKIASGNAQTCLHFGLVETAARFADVSRQHGVKVQWEGPQDAAKTGRSV